MTTPGSGPGSGQPPGYPDRPVADPGMPAPTIGRAVVGRSPVGAAVPPGPPGPPAGTAYPAGALPHPGQEYTGSGYPGQQPYPGQAYASAPYPGAYPAPAPVAAPPAVATGDPQAGSAVTGAATGAGAGAATGTTAASAATTAAARPLLAGVPGQRLAVPEVLRQDPPAPGPDAPPPPGGADPQQRLSRLRIGSHIASPAALAQLRVSAPGTGVIIGADQERRPVPVRLFGPDPTRVTLVGGVWASQLLAFRVLALGARVAVVTADPRNWDGFGERVTGRNDRVALVPADQPLALAATARQPVLVIHDVGLTGAVAPQPLGPWQAQLTVLRQLDRSGVPVLHASDLVLLQRLSSGESALVADVLRLPGASAQYLQAMTDDMLALVVDGVERYLWLAQTEVERQYGGAPRR
ncbi:hypothetical protein [Micromonospora echinofusca]|uniref:Uncharacterized protein n=1 Tax=Micromonospora echinofusca TaxID=47858 RepID=A0ABS3VSX4_MICEH|nr:hypothetical protein [Micromonospora echinofusca]MBO4207652.1 hypothetical protein [Micromonospora echinofusca]